MDSVSDKLRKDGYALFCPNALVDTKALLAECQKPIASIPRQKSFLGSLAVSRAVVDEAKKLCIEQKLVGYLGQAAAIKSVELYQSTPNENPYNSGQLWHLDIDFAKQIKMFFMCHPTIHSNGPFTFISAQDSTTVLEETGYVPGKSLDDRHLQGYSPIELIGDAGSLVLIDSSRCLHFGSRCASGTRTALVVQFT